MTGLEVLSELKKDEKTQSIPVFMLTAKAMGDDLSQALREGAPPIIKIDASTAVLGNAASGRDRGLRNKF